jgi:hypothetical protein
MTSRVCIGSSALTASHTHGAPQTPTSNAIPIHHLVSAPIRRPFSAGFRNKHCPVLRNPPGPHLPVAPWYSCAQFSEGVIERPAPESGHVCWSQRQHSIAPEGFVEYVQTRPDANCSVRGQRAATCARPRCGLYRNSDRWPMERPIHLHSIYYPLAIGAIFQWGLFVEVLLCRS